MSDYHTFPYPSKEVECHDCSIVPLQDYIPNNMADNDPCAVDHLVRQVLVGFRLVVVVVHLMAVEDRTFH